MVVLVAPNAMKGSLSASEFADAVEMGLLKSGIQKVIKHPLGDGGDGTAEIISSYFNASFQNVIVKDPLGRNIESGFYLNTDTAIIEMALACGLKLLTPSEYNPLITTSFGLGQLMCAALNTGVSKIILCVGGSATVDAGMGALMALGVKFYGIDGLISEGTGSTMGDVTYIDLSALLFVLKNVEVIIITDVSNPLLGQNGAVDVFAPQKGATANDLKVLRKNLSLFAGALFQAMGNDVTGINCGGAAGGIAASFFSLVGAKIFSGAEFVSELTNLPKYILQSDIVITGEGKMDITSLEGKVPGMVMKLAHHLNKPIYSVCATNGLNDLSGFEKIVCFNDEDLVLAFNSKDYTRKLIVQISYLLGVELKEKIWKTDV
jgi:glycerate 2-kinase